MTSNSQGRTSLESSRASMSRSTPLRIENPDPFNDDHAIDASPDLSPVDSIQNSSETLPLPPSRTSASMVPPPIAYTHFSRPTSTVKRPDQDGNAFPHRAISSVSQAESATHRTSSTSSRFSMPRPQSPYVATQGPSHPYAMYPQITRASSIASESTIRPLERPFLHTGGPEHPYSMYPQNPLPEDDDHIPVGFPGMGASYQTRSVDHDIAHLVGSDGHIEELPPYTRYAENMVPKETSPTDPPPLAPVPMSPVSQHSDSGVELNVGAARDAGVDSEKRGWRSKAKKRVCGGLRLWLLILIIVCVVLAASLGGVIGGVIGNENKADSQATSHSTTTVYLDGIPAPTYSPAPTTCPSGPFVVPILNDSKATNTNSCIIDPAYAATWDCLPAQSAIGINVGWVNTPGPSPGGAPLVSFVDYSILPPNFKLGPQPPYLNQTYTLEPYIDRDDPDLGVALFFWTFFCKVSILPDWALDPASQGSVSRREVFERSSAYAYMTAEIGQEVWACSFDDTIFEFFIYMNHTSPAYAAATQGSSMTAAATGSLVSTSSTTGSGTLLTSPTTSPSSSASSWTASAPSGWPTPERRRRELIYEATLPVYPKSVKMLEKRKTGYNPPGVCRKMVVQPDWSLAPVLVAASITVETNAYPASAATVGNRNRIRRDDTSELQSNCACEYFNF